MKLNKKTFSRILALTLSFTVFLSMSPVIAGNNASANDDSGGSTVLLGSPTGLSHWENPYDPLPTAQKTYKPTNSKFYGRNAETSFPKCNNSRTALELICAYCGSASKKIVSIPVNVRLISAIVFSYSKSMTERMPRKINWAPVFSARSVVSV